MLTSMPSSSNTYTQKKSDRCIVYVAQDIQDKCFSNPMMWITIWKLHSNVINSLKFFLPVALFLAVQLIDTSSFPMECIFCRVQLIQTDLATLQKARCWRGYSHCNIVIFLPYRISMVLFINSIQLKLRAQCIVRILNKLHSERDEKFSRAAGGYNFVHCGKLWNKSSVHINLCTKCYCVECSRRCPWSTHNNTTRHCIPALHPIKMNCIYKFETHFSLLHKEKQTMDGKMWEMHR